MAKPFSQQQASQGAKVSPFLATPTDLAPDGVTAVTNALNALAADSVALYLKAKNFHWHLAGPRFRDLHLLFDEHAAAIFASIDLLAERVRRIGGTTLRSISHVHQLTQIADDNDAFVTPDDMVRRLMADEEKVVASLRSAHDVCDDARDFATASIIENLIDEAERRKWFLFEVLQGLGSEMGATGIEEARKAA